MENHRKFHHLEKHFDLQLHVHFPGLAQEIFAAQTLCLSQGHFHQNEHLHWNSIFPTNKVRVRNTSEKSLTYD